MRTQNVFATLFACALPFSLIAEVAEIKGTILDPAQHPVPAAHVAAMNRTGVVAQQTANGAGEFSFDLPDDPDLQLVVTAPGFATKTVAPSERTIELAIAPQSDTIRVTGSSIDAPVSQQGSSVSVISSGEIRQSNEPLAVDLLRQIPGVIVAQSGSRGSVASMFVRGGDSKYNLALLNGIPINSFYYGGLFDFAHVPTDLVSEIDIARGPQSAVYGSYAIASVVSFVTRTPEDGPALDIVAEGGSHDEHRFSLNGSGAVKGWGLAGSLSDMYDGGPVRNSDYTNQDAFLSLSHRWGRQSLFAFGDYDWNEVGEPGAYGSNPKGYFSGLDTVSRSRNYGSTYGLHYQADITPRFRQDVFAGFSLNNNGYRSPYGTSHNKDIRANGEARETYSISRHWTMAGGFSYEREEVRNTYITSTSSKILLRRNEEGLYWENRFEFRNRLFLNVGVRGEIFQQPFVPANLYGYPPRPDFPSRTYSQASPKVSGVYLLTPETRIHASFGTGIRPPGGSDLAFTNNPALKPEHTLSYDVGVEQRLLHDRLSLDATWFHNRYKDLIVSLGGSLAKLSAFSTDNVNNARSEGVETSARFRPNSWFSATGSYTWLQAQYLSLNGSTLAQQYYTPGQLLPRRPRQSGTMMATVGRGRVDASVSGYFRGSTLDIEPNYGASGGLYTNPGYQNIGVNVNVRVRSNLTAYANVRNALNQKYEEIFGFPALRVNVVAGLKWSLHGAR